MSRRENWNRFENYFPGEAYCDWVALSAYGPTTPMTHDGTESLAFKMREAYPRLVKIAPGKPIIIAEFGCDLHNRRVNAADWAKAASKISSLIDGRRMSVSAGGTKAGKTTTTKNTIPI